MEFLLSIGLFLISFQFVRRLRLPLLTSLGLGLVLSWFLASTVRGVVLQIASAGLLVVLSMVVLAVVAVLVGLYVWGREVLENVPFFPSR